MGVCHRRAPRLGQNFRRLCGDHRLSRLLFWMELAARYPHAKVILTVRDPDAWFDSVSATIFSGSNNLPSLFGSRGQRLSQFLRRDLGARLGERAL